MHHDQQVPDLAGEVLAWRAEAYAARNGDSFEGSLEAVLGTAAGQRPQGLGSGPHRRESVEEWQANVARERADALDWNPPHETPNPSTDA